MNKETIIKNQDVFIANGKIISITKSGRSRIKAKEIIDGEDKTTEFYIEDESVASLQSYKNKTPSNHYFECVEDSRLAVLNYDKEQELFRRVPAYETLCRMSMETDFGEQQEALSRFIVSSPEERYKHLLESRPDLLQRVPQYYLASFLGVKPESLSRIRKRISKKK